MFELDYRYLVVLIGLLVSGYLLFGRRNIYGVWDPFFLALLGISFNAANIIYFGSDNTSNVIYAAAGFYIFFFAARFGLTHAQGRNCKAGLCDGSHFFQQPSQSMLKYLLVVCMLLQLVYYSFMFSKVGFGLLTGDASPDVKTMIFLEGFGVFKYILWASNYIVLPVFVYMLIFKISRPLVILSICLYVALNVIFVTSKVGLLMKIFEVGIVSIYLWNRYKIRFFTKKLFFILLATAAVPAVVVLSYFASEKGISPLFFFLGRVVDTGGGSYSYFVLEGAQVFNGLPLMDRLIYYFDTILSVFRLKDWADPNRTALVTQFITGDYQVGYGQNPYLFLDGHFLFGYFGGLVYIFFIGFYFGLIRLSTRFNVVVYFILVRLGLNLIVDPDMFQAAIVSLILFAPFVVIYYAIFYSKGRGHLRGGEIAC